MIENRLHYIIQVVKVESFNLYLPTILVHRVPSLGLVLALGEQGLEDVRVDLTTTARGHRRSIFWWTSSHTLGRGVRSIAEADRVEGLAVDIHQVLLLFAGL